MGIKFSKFHTWHKIFMLAASMNGKPLRPWIQRHPRRVSQRAIIEKFSPLLTPSLLIVLTWGVIQARSFLVPVSISALLAFSLAPGIHFLRKHNIPESVALFLSGVALLLPFPTFGYGLAKQFQSLTRDLPSIADSLSRWIQSTEAELTSTELAKQLFLGSAFRKSLDLEPVNLNQQLSERFSEIFEHGIQFAMTGISLAINTTSDIALVIFFTLLMLAFRKHIRTSTEKILAHPQASLLLDAITLLIERFLLARLVIVLMIAAIDILILRLFHIPYHLLMGSLLGIMTLIPAVGFILGVIPPILVSLATGHGGLQTLGMIGALLAVSFIEGNILAPKLIGHHLNINALVIFLGIFAGGLAWGISGMLLSVPLLGVLRIVFSMIPGTHAWGELLADRAEDPVSLKKSEPLIQRPFL